MTTGGISDLLNFIDKIKHRTDEYANSDVVLNLQEPTWPEFRQLNSCPPPPPPDVTIETVEQAHHVLPAYIRNHLGTSQNEMLILRSLPGTGKTTAAVKVAEELAAGGKRIAYAGPRHDFYQELVKKTEHPDWWYEWLPRQTGDDNKKETCRYTPAISQWMQRGYKAIEFCSQVCGWDYVGKSCPYHAQKNRTEPIIYIQHQHVCLGHPMEFDCVIGDESPVSAFIHDWRVPERFILPPGMPPDSGLTHLLYYTALIAANVESHMEGPELIDYLGGPDTVIDACQDFTAAPDDSFMAPKIRDPKDVDEVPYCHIFEFASLMRREAEGCKVGRKYPHRVMVSSQVLTLLSRHPVNSQLPPAIVWLDATANERIYKALFKRPARVVNIAPKLHGTIHQVYDRANGKGSLMQTNKKTKTTALTNRADQLSTLIKSIADRYERPAVIGFQKFLEQASLDIQSAHFYAARGSNAFEDCDAIIIAGTPQPNIYDIARIAKCVYYERDDAFRFDRFYAKPVRYQFIDPTDGLGREYPVSGFWDDDDLQSVLSITREDEILQSAHRGRPVNHPVDIWLLTNVPIDGLPPKRLVSMRDVLGLPIGVDVFKFHKFIDDCETIARDNNNVVKRSDLEALGYNPAVIRKYFEIMPVENWEDAKIKKDGSDKPVSVKIMRIAEKEMRSPY